MTVRRIHGGTRLAAGGAGLAAAALLLTGCGGTNTAANPPQQVSGSAVPVGGDSNGASSAPSTPAGAATPSGGAGQASSSQTSQAPSSQGTGTAAPAASSRCHTSDLKAAIGPNSPGAGQENFSIVLTNTSQRTCTVFGFPGVGFLNSAGQQVSVDPERTSAEKSVVKLAPGRSAWAPMTFANPGITGVTTVTPASVLVTPPDEKAALKVAWSGGPVTNTGKASVPRVSPFMPGTGA
jgi:hypothetical protein